MTSRWDVQFYNCQKLQSYEVTSRRLAKLRGNIQASGTDLDFVVNHLVYYGMWRWYPVHEAFQFPCFPFEPNIVVKYVALDLAWYLKLGRDPIIPSLIQTYPLYCSFPLFPADNGHHIIFGLSLFPADFPSFLQTFRLLADFPSILQKFPFSCRLSLFPADFPLSCRLHVYTTEVSFFLQTSSLTCILPVYTSKVSSFLQSYPPSCRLPVYTAKVSSFLQISSFTCILPFYNSEVSSFLQTYLRSCRLPFYTAEVSFFLLTSLPYCRSVPFPADLPSCAPTSAIT